MRTLIAICFIMLNVSVAFTQKSFEETIETAIETNDTTALIDLMDSIGITRKQSTLAHSNEIYRYLQTHRVKMGGMISELTSIIQQDKTSKSYLNTPLSHHITAEE
jgi:hypothetical protein